MISDDLGTDISEKIDILSMEDDKIKMVGEILSNGASRKILKLLFKNTMTANEISKVSEVSLPLVMYHLKKMKDVNMIRITNVGKTIKSKDVKFYTTTKFAIIIVSDTVTQKIKESKSIRRTFSGIYKFASIGIVAGAAWFISQLSQQTSNIVMTDIPSKGFMDIPIEDLEESGQIYPPDGITQIIPGDVLWSTIIALSVVVVGLIIERSFRARKNNLKH